MTLSSKRSRAPGGSVDPDGERQHQRQRQRQTPSGAATHQQYLPTGYNYQFAGAMPCRHRSAAASVSWAPSSVYPQYAQQQPPAVTSVPGNHFLLQVQHQQYLATGNDHQFAGAMPRRNAAASMSSTPSSVYPQHSQQQLPAAGVVTAVPENHLYSQLQHRQHPPTGNDHIQPAQHSSPLPAPQADHLADDVQFKIAIRQQPTAARACGFGMTDRRVIDPPPILKLSVQGPNLTKDKISQHLRYPHYVMTCTIWDESGTRDASIAHGFGGEQQLVGLTVSTGLFAKDEDGTEGCFFCFPDLSCRAQGAYRLKFNLFKVLLPPSKDRRSPFLATATSNVIHVYSAKDFPGMSKTSKLMKLLKSQGFFVRTKHGSGKRSEKDSTDSEST
ncbi:sexual development regulator velC [Fusarium beomiforme]|uniref:Sexual development regulator velC n=1 Tax=Fusarium beomiforme TaxID=44412 RepID=A0A9P5A7A1_9HYPO|nr:sexual development regulator velC [Fusarium beomiforme]